MCAVLVAENYPRDSEFRAYLMHLNCDGDSANVDHPWTLCYLLYHPRACFTLDINDVDQVGTAVCALFCHNDEGNITYS